MVSPAALPFALITAPAELVTVSRLSPMVPAPVIVD